MDIRSVVFWKNDENNEKKYKNFILIVKNSIGEIPMIDLANKMGIKEEELFLLRNRNYTSIKKKDLKDFSNCLKRVNDICKNSFIEQYIIAKIFLLHFYGTLEYSENTVSGKYIAEDKHVYNLSVKFDNDSLMYNFYNENQHSSAKIFKLKNGETCWHLQHSTTKKVLLKQNIEKRYIETRKEYALFNAEGYQTKYQIKNIKENYLIDLKTKNRVWPIASLYTDNQTETINLCRDENGIVRKVVSLDYLFEDEKYHKNKIYTYKSKKPITTKLIPICGDCGTIYKEMSSEENKNTFEQPVIFKKEYY